jgi:UDPglucose 6-dehydrogenase
MCRSGSCFPKDTRTLIKTAQDYESPIRVIETVIAVNENRKRAVARKVASIIDGSLRGKTVALLGLTFKPNTDDVRESPAQGFKYESVGRRSRSAT